jgi:hypothetical protein
MNKIILQIIVIIITPIIAYSAIPTEVTKEKVTLNTTYNGVYHTVCNEWTWQGEYPNYNLVCTGGTSGTPEDPINTKYRQTHVIYVLMIDDTVGCRYLAASTAQKDSASTNPQPGPSTSELQYSHDNCPCPEGKFRDPSGECSECPSGNFTLQGVCIPFCTHGTGMPVGSLYPHDNGVCVPPPCTEDEIEQDADPMLGVKCVPKCHTDRFNYITGLCTEPCPEGTYAETENSQCQDIPDCGPLMEWDSTRNLCVDKPSCGSNQIRNPDTGQCECDQGYAENPNNQTECISLQTEEQQKPDEEENNAPVGGNSNPGVIKENPDLPSNSVDQSQGTAENAHNPDSDGDGNPDNTNPDSNGNTSGTKTGYWGDAEKPVISNADHKWGVEKRVLDLKPIFDLETEVKKTDIYKAISKVSEITGKLVAPGSAPVFTFPVLGNTLTIDMSILNPVADIFRGMLSVFIWFCLIFLLLKQWRWL